LTAISLMSLTAVTLMGMVGAIVMYVGGHQIMSGTMTLGGVIRFSALLAFLVAAVFQVVGIGKQVPGGVPGVDCTQEVLREKPEDEDPRRTQPIAAIQGHVEFDRVSFEYDAGKPVLHEVSFESRPGTVTALVGPSGSGKSTIISLIAAFHEPGGGS